MSATPAPINKNLDIDNLSDIPISPKAMDVTKIVGPMIANIAFNAIAFSMLLNFKIKPATVNSIRPEISRNPTITSNVISIV